MARGLPAGTVTFLFTDVVGSTRLLDALGAERYAAVLAEHRRAIRSAVAAHGGVEVDTQGDAFFVAFPTAPGALQAAEDMVAALHEGPIRVRIGIHTGSPLVTEEGYVGADVHRAARIAACGHGGQVLVSASAAALAGAEGLRDLGDHRLKDLSAPERIYQVGTIEFPKLKSLHQTNLPVPATPFLGREHEVEEVTGLLVRDDVRLVTLTGTGGSGKTRLALQAAGAAADVFPAGVWWVPLAPLEDSALVTDTAAAALGATGELGELVGDKQLLLFLDNFEHVVDAAPDVAGVLERCPNLTVLVTSREPLRLDGEWEYAVDPLRDAEARDLFESRARAASRDFVGDAHVGTICKRLDNLPLAIELAAARVKVLSTAALLERLEQRLPLLAGGRRDAPERHRTLRATIAWSCDLLTDDEQAVFRRFGVFAGGATLDAAEAICDTDLDTVASLVDKSLVRLRGGDRFWMLETIREFALDRLDESGEAAELRRRHAEHFLQLAEDAAPHLPAYERAWVAALERDHDNLRAAFDHLRASNDTQGALRLGGALSRFWLMRGHMREGRRRLEQVLAADERPTAARAKGLTGAALLGADEKRGHAEEARALSHRLGDIRGVAEAELVLAGAVSRDDMAEARQLFESSAEHFREVGDEHSALIATRSLAWACINLGERELGVALHEGNLRRARALANERIQAITLGVLALERFESGRDDDGLAMLEESHRLHVAIGDPFQTALSVFRFAAALAMRGAASTAASVVSAADALADEAGGSLLQWDADFVEEVEATIRERLDNDAFSEACVRGRELTPEEAVALALTELRA